MTTEPNVAGTVADEDLCPLSSPDDVDAAGVDLTLIRWSLKLTPRERLEVSTEWANSLSRMRDAAAARLHRDP
jgi:hypothetical protein